MQRRVAITVLVVEIVDPAEQVDESDLSLRVCSPVQRRTASIVFTPHVHSLLLEVVY